MPAYYALYAQAYMAKHGLTHDDLMNVRIKASTYGVVNERAVYRKGVKPEDFKQGDPEAKMAGPWHGRSGWVIAVQTQTEFLHHPCQR